MGKPHKLTPSNRATFLARVARTGQMAASAKAIGVTETTVGAARKRDPEFDAAVREALALYSDGLEAEAHRRAVEGVDRDVYHNGKKVGKEKRYSDTLLLAMLKRRIPDYRERAVDVNVGQGGVLVVSDRPASERVWRERIEAPKEKE